MVDGVGTSHIVRTPMVERLPIVAGIALGLIVAGLVSTSAWVRVAVFVGIAVAWALILGLVFGVPLSRIVTYREPPSETALDDADRPS
jgi:hypothetical protein